MFRCSLRCLFLLIIRRVLLSFPFGVTLKNIGERKLAGLKNLCGRMYDCGSKHTGAWNGIHGMAHERGVEKASQHSSLRHRHSLGGLALCKRYA
ncbi:hypothetical protein BGZ57DRAFT_411340 [Hyaloscypha finlandica]|jgi:hypothetical protein|nr:hypothetical protein BGZ57DRAFT_411340 [Hyaloscypha finlandica]KAH8793808.1 hypothetical protein F5882DRAFT_55561 [Hyaloscypha sp. PMI_1271]